jgi:hypothetical protein
VVCAGGLANGAAGPMVCASTDYVKNTHMPGSYTDRPDSGGNLLRTQVDPIVSAVPDFGCGVKTTGGIVGANAVIVGGVITVPAVNSVASPDQLSGGDVGSGVYCNEAFVNLHDRVNGNVSQSTLGAVGDAVNSGNGQNTAPTAAGQCAGNGAGQNCGTLVGSLVSTVTIAQEIGEDGMPSGSITFSRTDQGIVDFAQSINQVVAGLYTFSETDVNGAPFQSLIPGAPSVPGGICSFPTVCNNDAGGRTSGGTGALPSYVGAGLPITATLSLVQEAMGGEPGSVGQVHGRLIFLHRLRRFDPLDDTHTRPIPRSDVGVGGGATRHLQAVLLPKSVACASRKAQGVRSSRPY